MVATLNFIEYTGVTSTFTPTQINLGSTNAANLNPTLYPCSAGSSSYEKWLKMYFTGAFTRVENLRIWKSSGSYVTGEVINYTGQKVAFVTPTNSASTFATAAMVTSTPSSANVSIGGSLTGSLLAPGYSNYIVLQASISVAASSGATQNKILVFSWDEIP